MHFHKSISNSEIRFDIQQQQNIDYLNIIKTTTYVMTIENSKKVV